MQNNSLNKLGIEIDPELFILSLTHRSFAHENGGIPTNERLEFLGDAVLELAVTEKLFKLFPDSPEGQLTKLRSKIVSEDSLASIAKELELGSLVLLGKGEELCGGREKPSILSDCLEAVFGAVFLSLGQDAATKYILKLLEGRIEKLTETQNALEPKNELQEFMVSENLGKPKYTYSAKGPDHNRTYFAKIVDSKGIELASAHAKSKKKASTKAASIAIEKLKKQIKDV